MFKVYYDNKSEIDNLCSLSFKGLADNVNNLTAEQKSQLLVEIQKILDNFGVSLKKYHDCTFMKDRMTTNEFEYIMWKWKKLDNIRYYLLEMPILMEETPLDKQIKSLATQLDKVHWKDDAKYKRYSKLLDKKYERGYHGNEIQDEAQRLVNKYLK